MSDPVDKKIEDVLLAVLTGATLDAEAKTVLNAVLFRAAVCRDRTSFDQGVPTRCMLPKGHEGIHAGLSRDRVVRW